MKAPGSPVSGSLPSPRRSACLRRRTPTRTPISTISFSRFGIYGAHDFNPYIAKIVCHRLGQGVDPDAAATAHFLSINLPRGTTQVQAYQFLGTAVGKYCPDLGKLQNIPAR